MSFNALEHLKSLDEKYTAIYRGRVESDADPLKAGRVRVRAYPVFWNEAEIPVEALPWAIPCEPNFSAGVPELAGAGENGADIGWRAVPDVGSFVWVFFEEGDIYQPVYMGAAPSINPAGIPQGPRATRIPDPSVEARTARLSIGVEKVRPGQTFDEPPPAYAAVYPRNKVRKTFGGILEELDDTPGQRRLAWYHPSGTNVEIDEEGNMTLHVVKNLHITVEEDFTFHVRRDSSQHIDRDMQVQIDGRLDVHSDGETKIESEDDMLVVSGAIQIVRGETNQQIQSGALQRIEASGAQMVEVGAERVVKVAGAHTLDSGGVAALQGSTVQLNLPVAVGNPVPSLDPDTVVLP